MKYHAHTMHLIDRRAREPMRRVDKTERPIVTCNKAADPDAVKRHMASEYGMDPFHDREGPTLANTLRVPETHGNTQSPVTHVTKEDEDE